MATAQELYAYSQNPNVRRFLNVVAQAEGTTGYDTAFGGGTIPSLADHPRQLHSFNQTDGRENKTSAAGRYQFLQGTWDDVAGKLDLPDFGPQSQDIAAVELLRRNGSLEPLLQGDFQTALDRSGTTWASLPSSPYPQPKRSDGFIARALDKGAQMVFPAAQAGTLPQTGVAEKVAKARQAGYSDAEIASFLGEKSDVSAKIEQARQAGYSDDEIYGHLGIQPPTIHQSVAPNGDMVRWQEEPQEQSFAQDAGQAIMDIPRQLGLTARYGIEGLGQAASVLTEPIRQAINPVLGAVGLPRAAQTGNVASSFADTLGLPQPLTANERVVGDASRLLAGGGGIMGASGLLSRGATGATQAVLQGLASNPGQQIASATGAGLAGGSVREAGGGPVAQTVASFAGGLAGPMALNTARSTANSVSNRVKSLTPKMVDSQVDIILQRSGTEWSKVPERVRASIRSDVTRALRAGEDLDPAAVRRLADLRSIEGVTPTRGAVTLRPVDVTRERNLAKIGANTDDESLHLLSNIENANNRALVQTLDRAGAENADDAYTAGQRIIDTVQGRIDARKNQVGSLYSAARDTSGRSLSLDGAAFANRIIPELDDALLGGAIPAEVRNRINDIASGKVPFTIEFAEQFKTQIGNLQRDAQRNPSGGSTSRALGMVRQALDDTPLLTQRPDRMSPVANEIGEQSIAAFNQARKANRDMMNWIRSSKAIKDISEGKVTPDQFVNRHIISKSAASKDLANLAEVVRSDPVAHQSIKGYILSYLRDKAVKNPVDGEGNFSPAAFNGAINSIGQRKLSAFFSPEEIAQLLTLGRAANYLKFQPAGSAVNNSNSGALGLGGALDWMAKTSKKAPLIGDVIHGQIRGLQQRGAIDLAPAITLPAPTMPSNRMLPATMYGGLLGLAPIPPRQDDRR